MEKRLLLILRSISQKMKEFDAEQIVDVLHIDDMELEEIGEELDEIEFSENIEEDLLDNFKALLVYILLRNDMYEKEEVYSTVFGGGRRITWN